MTRSTAPGRSGRPEYGYSPSVFARTAAGMANFAVSSGRRILDGPAFTIDEALGRSTSSNCIALAA